MYGFNYGLFMKRIEDREKKEKAKPTVERKGTRNELKYNEYVKSIQPRSSFNNKKPK